MKVKRMMAVLLAAGMTLSAAACGGDDAGTKSAGNTGESAGTAGETAAGGTEETGTPEAAVIDMEEEPYTVAIQVVTLPGTNLEQEEEIEERINEITLPAINCKVDIQNSWISEVASTTSMGVAGGEKLDLVHVATVQSFGSIAGADLLYDMNQDDLIQTHGQQLIGLFGDYLQTGQLNGQQLAVPAETWYSRGLGVYYNQTLADSYGVSLPEETDLDGIEEVLYQVKEKDGDIYPYYTGSGSQMLLQYFYNYESYGSNCAYGVVLDSSKDATVVNMYETDLFRDYCLRMMKWNQEGLMPGDPTDTNTNQSYFSADKLFMVPCEVTPGAKAQVGSGYPDMTLGWSTTGTQKITNGTVSAYMWGIAANCERPDKAMDFLNFLYSNEEVANLLKYGIEGTNYEFVDGSDQVIQVNGTWPVNFYRGGDQSRMYITTPSDENFVAEWEAFDAAAEVSPLVGYMFNDADYQAESAVITSTITEYLPRLQCGTCASEEEVLALLDEFNQKLDAAGIHDVIAANQAQLDEYLAGQK